MAAIYFHIPFCKRLCGYCDFLRSVKIQHIPQVVEMMHKELEEQHSFLTEREIKTIYFGGGTPSLLHPSEIERLIDHCRALFDCSTVEEITVEVNVNGESVAKQKVNVVLIKSTWYVDNTSLDTKLLYSIAD